MNLALRITTLIFIRQAIAATYVMPVPIQIRVAAITSSDGEFAIWLDPDAAAHVSPQAPIGKRGL